MVTVDGDTTQAAAVASRVPTCGPVDVHGQELTIVTTDGAAAIGSVAIALGAANINLKSMTLRRPTLDDVFLELTGAHL